LKQHDIYLTSTNQLELMTSITSVGSDTRGPYVTTAHQIFHPQGGGQPADVGIIETASGQIFEVEHTAWSAEEIRLYGALEASQAWVGQSVKCEVNKERRFENAKLHTAGHLLAQVAEALDSRLKAKKGHHFPGQSYIEFETITEERPVIDRSELETALMRALEDDHPIYVKLEESRDLRQAGGRGLRTVQIGGYNPLPCGGTHVNSLACIGKIQIVSQKWKSQLLRIRYSVQRD